MTTRLLRTLLCFTSVGASVSAIGCVIEKHVVGTGLPFADAGSGDMSVPDVVPDLGTADASVPDLIPELGATPEAGATDASDAPGTVVSLGDKTSLGWAIAIPPEEVARRLSQLMLQTPPTPGLRAAVIASGPRTNEDVGNLADGLLLAGDTAPGRQAFYRWWLSLDQFPTQNRDPVLFPLFTNTTATTLVQQALAFAEDVTWQPRGSLTTLLTEPAAFITTDTASWYGGAIAFAGVAATKVALPANRYAGILTQPAVVATHDYPTRTEPIRRGLDVRRRYLCQFVPPEPPLVAVAPIPAGMTTRQWLESATSPSSCTACHSLVDPPGFAFGHFDAVGAYRETEDGAPVITTGTLRMTSAGDSVAFAGITDLAAELAALPEARSCFAAHWLTFATGAIRNGLVPASTGSTAAPIYGPDPSVLDPFALPPSFDPSPAFAADVDYIVKRATVQGELNLRGTLRAVTETHGFLDP